MIGTSEWEMAGSIRGKRGLFRMYKSLLMELELETCNVLDCD